MQAKQKRKPSKSKSVAIVPTDHYLLDPRQLQCWNLYVDPKSGTFGNATQSALTAGYSPGHANLITTEKWFKEKVRRLNMLSKAERNLEEALDLPMKTQAMGAFGPIFETKKVKVKLKNGKTKMRNEKGSPIMVHNIGLLTLRTNTAQFIAERVGRSRYGKKDEGSGNTYNLIVFADAQRKRIAQRIVGGGSAGGSKGE